MRERDTRYTEESTGYDRSAVYRRLQRLSDMSDWDVQEGPDIRGWSVIDRDGYQVGKVDDLLIDPDTGETEFVVVSYGGIMGLGAHRTLVPMDQMDIKETNSIVVLDRSSDELKSAPMYQDDTTDYDQFVSYWRGGATAVERERGYRERATTEAGRMVIPEVEEHLETGKRSEQVGEVEVRKEVETHPETVRETLHKTRVRVYRRAVEPGREVREGEAVLREGESVTIPIVEEKMIVEKRPEVTGEVVIEPETVEQEATTTREVRRERVEVEKRGEAEIEEDKKRAA